MNGTSGSENQCAYTENAQKDIFPNEIIAWTESFFPICYKFNGNLCERDLEMVNICICYKCIASNQLQNALPEREVQELKNRMHQSNR